MTTTTRRDQDLPELDAEREVDLRSYWDRIASHWWLPAAGLAVGLVIGYLISLGGSQVYRGKAVVYLGQPLSASGVQIQSQATNPSTVRTIVTSEATIDSVARKVGLKPSQLRGHISTQAVTGNITRLGQSPLVSISVTGGLRGKIAHERARRLLSLSVVIVAYESGEALARCLRSLPDEAEVIVVDNGGSDSEVVAAAGDGRVRLVEPRENLGFDDLVRLDFYYLENWSIWLDISILAKTIPAVMSGRGAY